MGQSQAHGLHDSAGSLGHKMIAATRRAWATYWMHRAARATAGILHTLDDRALKDIGLDRSEIESVACECQTRGSRVPDRRVCLC
jgi:uncharacterized protein YjiS (DUF1127 family)